MSPAPDLGGVTRTRRQQQQGEPQNHPHTPQGSPQPFSGGSFPPLRAWNEAKRGGSPTPVTNPFRHSCGNTARLPSASCIDGKRAGGNN